ncbi:peptidoglycan D,D-transpeptidase FtsI family protein [Agromyces seonyuensis]|uniref:Penicillin-binding protein 2 n=1 Tax=Agromyces seonyuensis TaxID=2662446 RepID=A0A6I4NWI8_9MICO|nr:penicillin-binding protein 2 [Agromyces seonyuensis]MWB98653.1 penicillin-binding protein 2 [Agromyces seonyuensis]
MSRVRGNTGRVAAFGLVLAILVGVFAVRLFDIQVVRAAELNEQADGIRSGSRTVWGTRGSIVDASGAELASTVTRWDIAIGPKDATLETRKVADTVDPTKTHEVVVPVAEVLAERAEVFAELGAVLGMSGESITKIVGDSLAADPDANFAYLAKLVDNSVREQIVDLDLPWVGIVRHPSRTYPQGAVAGNLVGFTDTDGNPLAGLESSENSCLAGQNGQERYLQARGDWVEIPGTVETEVPAKDGGTLHLSIDSDLQFRAQSIVADQVQAVQAEWATAVVQEVKTGRLIAVVDVPTVDPNARDATDVADRGSRVFTAPYEPGSTFKAVTAASVVDAGKATPTDGVEAPYRWVEPGINLADSEFHETEKLTLTGVLIESSNTGMLQFGTRLGDDERFDYDSKFGFGAVSEVGFLGEEDGTIANVADPPDKQSKYATTFGQSLTVTAVQMASAYQTIANGGERMPVSLVDGCELADGTMTEQRSDTGSRVISEDAAAQTTAMLEQVYENSWVHDKWAIPGYRVASKTGTAQVPDLVNGGYQDGYLVSAAGFAPADDPQYVVSVSIMNPVKMNSSAAAAPVFQQIMSQVLMANRVVPSGTSAPELPATW